MSLRTVKSETMRCEACNDIVEDENEVNLCYKCAEAVLYMFEPNEQEEVDAFINRLNGKKS